MTRFWKWMVVLSFSLNFVLAGGIAFLADQTMLGFWDQLAVIKSVSSGQQQLRREVNELKALLQKRQQVSLTGD